MSLKTGKPCLPAAIIGWLLLTPWTAGADSAWRWRDAQGVLHYSDSGPPAGSLDTTELKLPPAVLAPAQGLRSGERRALQARDARSERQRRRASSRAAQAGRELERQRNACQKARERLRTEDGREQRKRQSSYLRRHCW